MFQILKYFVLHVECNAEVIGRNYVYSSLFTFSNIRSSIILPPHNHHLLFTSFFPISPPAICFPALNHALPHPPNIYQLHVRTSLNSCPLNLFLPPTSLPCWKTFPIYLCCLSFASPVTNLTHHIQTLVTCTYSNLIESESLNQFNSLIDFLCACIFLYFPDSSKRDHMSIADWYNNFMKYQTSEKNTIIGK